MRARAKYRGGFGVGSGFLHMAPKEQAAKKKNIKENP
jgi:hypothetical protein